MDCTDYAHTKTLWRGAKALARHIDREERLAKVRKDYHERCQTYLQEQGQNDEAYARLLHDHLTSPEEDKAWEDSRTAAWDKFLRKTPVRPYAPPGLLAAYAAAVAAATPLPLSIRLP